VVKALILNKILDSYVLILVNCIEHYPSMKTTFKILLLPLALLVLFTQCEKDPVHVDIPDDAFLTALIERGVDTNGDNIISPAEAAVVTFLSVSRYDISDMTGIEAFINLDTLLCQSNQLTSLDVSNNTELRNLGCARTQLTSLDVSNNFALEQLNISEMPSLHEVCVWEIPFPPEGVHVFTTGSPNVYFTTECSK